MLASSPRTPVMAIALTSVLASACGGESDISAPDADPTLAEPQYSAVTDNFFVPAGGSFFNVCTNEWVGFDEGAGFHIVIRSNETPHGMQIGFHENGINLHGPGLDAPAPGGNPTGTQYRGMLSIDEIINVRPPYPQTVTSLLRIIVNATGDLPDRVTYQTFHATVNALGEITAWVDEPFMVECKG